MKKKLYLGNGVYISLEYSGSGKCYRVVLDFYDETGKIARRTIDYCDTYIDAIYHFNDLKLKHFSIF